jgi:undecaprenyl-diphosphatase
VTDLDLRALLALHGDGHGAWGATMIAATLLGEGWTALLLLPMLAYARTRRFAGALALGVVAQAVLVWALKLAVGRVRPWIALGLATPFGAPHDPSFPSGHAAGTFCVAAFLAAALPAAWPDARAWTRACVTLAVGLSVLISLSRVYLAVHFPSDVLTGALLGAVVGTIAGRRYASATRLDAPQSPAVGVEQAPKRG